jgi:hypothetical protein
MINLGSDQIMESHAPSLLSIKRRRIRPFPFSPFSRIKATARVLNEKIDP